MNIEDADPVVQNFQNNLDRRRMIKKFHRQRKLMESVGSGKILEWNAFYAMIDIYMQILLHFNEDFDDDLLKDAMELLNI